jgi:hypothetical protein
MSITERLFDINVRGEFADCPAAALDLMTALQVKLKQQQAEIERLHRELEMLYDAKEDHEDALTQILRWSEAYPIDLFPEPDLMRARHVLEAAGLTLDAISASAMRHAVEGVGRIASEALNG